MGGHKYGIRELLISSYKICCFFKKIPVQHHQLQNFQVKKSLPHHPTKEMNISSMSSATTTNNNVRISTDSHKHLQSEYLKRCYIGIKDRPVYRALCELTYINIFALVAHCTYIYTWEALARIKCKTTQKSSSAVVLSLFTM